MRILLVSDVHGNRAALEAIREEFDVCLFLGDLVDYGTEPGPCIEWMRRWMNYGVRGNHDHGAAQRVWVAGAAGFRYLTGATRQVTCARMSEPERRFLAELPVTRWLTLGGLRFLLVHATPRDPMEEFGRPDLDFWEKRLKGIDADFVCVGHTHVQFKLRVGATTVVNPGAVGIQRDGDPRAGYAIIDDGAVDLRRVDYPIDEAIASVERAPLPDRAKEMLGEVYRTGRLLIKGQGVGPDPSSNGNGIG